MCEIVYFNFKVPVKQISEQYLILYIDMFLVNTQSYAGIVMDFDWRLQ